MVAPNYSAESHALAKQVRLGRKSAAPPAGGEAKVPAQRAPPDHGFGPNQRSFIAMPTRSAIRTPVVMTCTVDALPIPYAARLDVFWKRQGMSSSIRLWGWPSRMACRVSAM